MNDLQETLGGASNAKGSSSNQCSTKDPSVSKAKQWRSDHVRHQLKFIIYLISVIRIIKMLVRDFLTISYWNHKMNLKNRKN